MDVTVFVESEWRDRCRKMVDDATNRCGQSDFMFMEFVSKSIENAICSVSLDNRLVALEIAREYGYEGPDERAKQRQENADYGLCSHGLDPDCCPVGCGDLDVYNEEHE